MGLSCPPFLVLRGSDDELEGSRGKNSTCPQTKIAPEQEAVSGALVLLCSKL